MKMLKLVLVFALLGLSNGVSLDSMQIEAIERIHGGAPAPQGYAPHMVALLTTGTLDRVMCGGSVVTQRHVLTAAHCITPFVVDDQLASNFVGRVGSNIWHSGGSIVHFKSQHVHPQWDADIIKYDAGVLEMTEPLEFNEAVTPIGLDFGWVDGDEITYVTGWGTTWPKIDEISVNLAPTPDKLQLLYMKTLTPAECQEKILSSLSWASVAPPLDPELEICTFHSIRHGMCHGDSGSALVSAGSRRQVGMVSWGMPCAVGAPDFHTRLRGVKEFLLPILRTCPTFQH